MTWKELSLPRVEIAHLPTPVEPLTRLTERLPGLELWIKRDDLTGLAFGGNKTRKLEFLIGNALADGADVVLTTGAAQSNHCRQTAAAAARKGLDCMLVLVGPEPDTPSGNLFLDQLLGARVVWTEQGDRDAALEKTYQEAKQAGGRPYLIPYGGSNALGACAYFLAYQEMMDQLEGHHPDWIVFPSSSGGTQAGLFLAASVLGGPRVLGISVDQMEEDLRDRIAGIARELADLLGISPVIKPAEILVSGDYTGDGYGIMNDRDREAIHTFAEQEGILLDPVYTGRAAGGLLDLAKSGFFKGSQRILFWHTGGTPGLFADRYLAEI